MSCHNGQPRADGPTICDLRGSVMLTNWTSVTPGNGGGHAGKFSVGYDALVRHVRRPGIESDYHMLTPMEFHADTTDLVQLLKAGHQGVRLDEEAWDRLITWIDLNCPYHGTWGEIDKPGKQAERRRDLLRLYAGVEDDPEAIRETEFTALKAPAQRITAGGRGCDQGLHKRPSLPPPVGPSMLLRRSGARRKRRPPLPAAWTWATA